MLFRSSKNLLDYYALTALQTDPTATTATTLTSGHFYKSSVSIIPVLPQNVDVENFVSISGTTVTTTTTTATVSNLNNKTIPFRLTTFDWRAMYWDNQKNISAVFYSALNDTPPAMPLGTHVLTAAVSPADQKTIVLTDFFAFLDSKGKTELWRTNADNVKVVFYNSAGVVVAPGVVGVSYQFKDANGNNLGGLNATFVRPADAVNLKDIRKIEYTFDETVAVPGNYTAKLEFTDIRPYAAGTEFKLSMPFTIQNPDLTATFEALKEKKANLFNGQNLIVYGTYVNGTVYNGFTADRVATAQTVVGTAYYDLFNAYKNIYKPDVVNYAGPLAPATTPTQLVDGSWLKFIKTAPATTVALPDPMIAGLITIPTMTDRFWIYANSMYKDYSVKLRFYYFGNVANFVDLETITVTPHSEVADGEILAKTSAKPAGWLLPANLQVTNGNNVTMVPLSYYWKAEDYLDNNIFAFGMNDANTVVARDVRITGGVAKVEVLKTDPTYAHLVDVFTGYPGVAAGVSATGALPANANDFYITGVAPVAAIQTDVQVELTVKITDIFGQVLQQKIYVTVKKN